MEYVVGIVVVVIIGIVVYILAMKDKKKTEEFASKLTEEETSRLAATEIVPVEGKKNTWVQEAYICDVTEKGGKVEVKLLYFNKVINNIYLNKLAGANTTVSKADFESKGLKVGSFVQLQINAEKAVATIL